MKEKLKGYQEGFLNAIGVSVDEVLTLKDKEIWALIYSFCELNDTIIIFEEKDRYLLGRFCILCEEERNDLIDSFIQKVFKIREELSE